MGSLSVPGHSMITWNTEHISNKKTTYIKIHPIEV